MTKKWVIILCMGCLASGRARQASLNISGHSLSHQNLNSRAMIRWDGNIPVRNENRFSDGAPDTVRVLALMAEFQPDTHARTTGDGTFDMSTPESPVVDPPPHDRRYFMNQMLALSNYYQAVSGGRLVITGDVFEPVLTLPRQMSDYNPETTEEAEDRGLVEIFRDAVQLADTAGAVFSEYDATIVFHAGVGRDIAFDYDPTPRDIRSAFLNLGDLERFLGSGDGSYAGISVEQGTHRVTEGILLPETESQDGYEIGLLGTTVLMFGFQLGMPALWDTETGASGAGRWAMMDQGSGNFNGLIPCHPDAFTKIFMGWEKAVDIDDMPLAGENGARRIELGCALSAHPWKICKVPVNDHEYFLLENRQYDVNGDSAAAGTDARGNPVRFLASGQIELVSDADVIVRIDEYDFGLPGSGILIWHVDENVILENLADNRINVDKDHRGVDLEEADGPQDIGESYGFLSGGAGSENGVMQDAWYAGNDMHLKSNESDSVMFGPDTYPGSRAYDGADSHSTFYEFSDRDTVMYCVRAGAWQPSGFPQYVGDGLTLYAPVSAHPGTGNDPLLRDVFVVTAEGRIFTWQTLQNEWQVRATVSGDTEHVRVNLLADIGKSITAPPVVMQWRDTESGGPADLMLAAEDGEVLALRGDSRQTVFQSPESVTALMGAGDRLIIGSAGGRVTMLHRDLEIIRQQEALSGAVTGMAAGIDADSMNIYVTSSEGEVLCLNRDGMRSWLIHFESGQSLLPPVTAWLSGTQRAVFVLSETGRGAVFSTEGETLFSFGSPESSEPGLMAVGDADGDGFAEIFYPAGGSLWGWNHNGSLMEYMPAFVRTPHAMVSSPLLADFDGDGGMEIAVSTSSGTLEVFELNGRSVGGFPLSHGGKAAATPLLVRPSAESPDYLAAVSERGYLYTWRLPAAVTPETVIWGAEGHDPGRTSANSLKPAAAIPAEGPVLPENLAYNYPNPARGGYTTIRYRLSETAQVHIQIFDMAGELVDEFDGPGEAPADNEIRWETGDVDSGVYFCRIRAKTISGEQTTMIKIGVSH